MSSAQRANSAFVFFSQKSASSAPSLNTSRSIFGFIFRPIPIAFVRGVLMALLAIGAAIYSILARSRSIWLFRSISSRVLPDFALNPLNALLRYDAPASPYPFPLPRKITIPLIFAPYQSRGITPTTLLGLIPSVLFSSSSISVSSSSIAFLISARSRL